MTLVIDYSTKTFLVLHPNGKSEGFSTIAAAYARYPELDKPMTEKRTKLAKRQERIEAGVR